MYILKTAIRNIMRNKGRNILIGIVIIVIACSCAITLAIRQSATDIVESYKNKYQIEATIGMNRESLMNSLRGEDQSREEMIEAFNEIESLTLDEIITYGELKSVSSYHYTYSLGVDATDLDEATDSLIKETTETKTETETFSGGMPGGPGGGGFGGGSKKTTTTTKTEKIFNEKAQNGAFTLVGYNSYEAMTAFINGKYTITEGSVSADFEASSCVISEELASLNELEVGDTIEIVDPEDDDNTYELTITGIYKENTDEASDMSAMFSNSANTIITNVNFVKNIVEKNDELAPTITPTYVFETEEDLETFKEDVTEKGLSEYFQITDNLDVVNGATKSIDNVKTFATTFLIITLIIGAVVLMVINVINIRERKYEIGVLRTIGMKKTKVSLQFICELLIVAIISLLIGAGIGSVASVDVANNLLANEIENASSDYESISDNFGGIGTPPNENNESKDDANSNSSNENRGGRDDMNINFQGIANVEQVDSIEAVVDIKVLFQLLAIGLGITLLSSIVSMISIHRFSPLTILKERG